MALDSKQVPPATTLDAEAEHHRGQRDGFAGKYDPPTATSVAAHLVEAAKTAYDEGYQLTSQISP